MHSVCSLGYYTHSHAVRDEGGSVGNLIMRLVSERTEVEHYRFALPFLEALYPFTYVEERAAGRRIEFLCHVLKHRHLQVYIFYNLYIEC